jgi:hypothetical protein
MASSLDRRWPSSSPLISTTFLSSSPCLLLVAAGQSHLLVLEIGMMVRDSMVLVFWSAKNWLVLLDNLDNPLVGRSVEKGETIHVGSLVCFNSHIAKVQSYFFSPWPSKEPSPLHWNVMCSSFVKGDWSDQ